MPILNNSKPRPWLPNQKKQAGRRFKNKDYHTVRWRVLRAHILKENPLCAECAKKNIIEPATVVDHITPVSAGGDMWSPANLQPLCEACHNSKSGRERHTKGK